MLNQSQTQARDLAEQMGQRLKVTEAMLAEAVKARERLVADNESAVEGLLATISSKDQLLKVQIDLRKCFIGTHSNACSNNQNTQIFADHVLFTCMS